MSLLQLPAKKQAFLASHIGRKFSAALEAPGAADRITPIEGMRGYAVLLVFLVHHHSLFGEYLAPKGLLYEISRAAQDIGYSGVDLFFVLSGFLIYGHLMQKATPYWSFFRKRVRRIYPTFLAVFCIYLLLSLCLPSLSKLPHSITESVVYLVANLIFLPGLFNIHALITVAWSLSYEFFFYLAIPLIIGMTGMRRWSRSRRVLFFMGLFAFHCIAYRLGWLPHIRLSMFIAGIVLYEATDGRWFIPALSKSGEITVIVLYVAAALVLILFELSDQRFAYNPHFPNNNFIWSTVILSVALPAVILYGLAFDGVLKRMFSWTPMRWLGMMSYSYFLFHGLILNGVVVVLTYLRLLSGPSAVLLAVVLLVNLLLTIIGSLILFVLVERRVSLLPKTAGRQRGRSDESIAPAERKVARAGAGT